MRDLSLGDGERGAVGYEEFRGQVEQRFARFRRNFVELGGHVRRRPAAERSRIERSQFGVRHDQANGGNGQTQFLGHGLGERSANVLAHLGFPGENRHRAVLADVQPGADFRRAAAVPSAWPPAPGLLRRRGLRQKQHHQTTAEHLEEFAPVQLKTIQRRGVKLVALRLQNDFRHVPSAHFSPRVFAASLIAATIRW